MPTDPALLPHDEADRLAVVRSLGLLEQRREERFDRVARVLAALLDVPVAFVSLMDAEELVYKGCTGLDAASAPRESTFCAHAVVSGRLLVVPDLAAHAVFRHSRYVTEDGFRFYAGQPLRVRGHVVGTMCAMDHRPRELTAEQSDLLADLASWAEGELVAVELAELVAKEQAGDSLLHAVQQRDELILQFADQAVFGVDGEGYVTFANPAAARLLGDDLEDMVGRSFHESYHHTRADGSPYPWQECPTHDVLASGRRRRVARDLLHRRDGTTVEVEYSAAPLVVDDVVAGAVVTISDISRRRAVERLKDEFVSVVSHELRTPLTSIRGSLGLLGSGRFGELPAQAQRLVDIALTNTERLVRLVNDILDLERIEAGRLEVVPRRQPIGPLVDAAVEAVTGVAEAARVRLETAGSRDVEADVDADLLVRALTNLLGNAVKFSDAGATVTTELSAAGGRVRIAVRDTGRGIPPERLDRIFERFEQVDASDAREKGGTGLGLTITRSIVERHGGTVSVTSRLGEGTTFVVDLPAPESASDQSGGVIVVEDDEDLVELLTAALEPLAVPVASTGRAGDAVELVRARSPRLLVLDVELADGSGLDVVARLRELGTWTALPVVVTTVHELDAEQRELLSLGRTWYVPKGVGGDVVAQVADIARVVLAEDLA